MTRKSGTAWPETDDVSCSPSTARDYGHRIEEPAPPTTADANEQVGRRRRGPARAAAVRLLRVWRGQRKQWRHARQLRRADVCLISYPKSGRTWLRLLVGEAIDAHFDLGATPTMRLEVWPLRELREGVPAVFVYHDDLPQQKTPDELHASKSKYRHKKVIFLARDPRDVMVSQYFHRTKRRSTS